MAEPGSVQHEIGGGISGQVNGHRVALGNLEWIQKHAQLPWNNPHVQSKADSAPSHSQTEVWLSSSYCLFLLTFSQHCNGEILRYAS